MPKKTQKLWNMKGCSKSKRSLGGKSRRRGGCWTKKNGGRVRPRRGVCKKCGPNCTCGARCICGRNCNGKCYLKGIRNGKQMGGNCKKCGMKKGCNCGMQMGGNCNCGMQMGGCGSCLGGGVPLQSGGGINNGGQALIGAPWTSSNWPGVAGKDGSPNFYANNKYLVDPQTAMVSERDQQTFMKGGSRKRRAGGIIPDDLVNLGRSMVYGIGSAYNTLNGFQPPVNPLPYKDQLVNTPSAKALGY